MPSGCNRFRDDKDRFSGKCLCLPVVVRLLYQCKIPASIVATNLVGDLLAIFIGFGDKDISQTYPISAGSRF